MNTHFNMNKDTSPKIKRLTVWCCILVLSFILLQSPAKAQAQTYTLPETYTLLEPLPCIPHPAAKNADGTLIAGTEETCGDVGGAGGLKEQIAFKDYVQYVFNLLIALAATAAVVMIVLGGLQYMTTDAWTEKKEGLAKVKHAVLGLLLILSSYLLLRTIDPRLVEIPSTLVPALPDRIRNVQNVSSSFFNRITADADRYRLQAQQAARNVTAAKEEVETLNEQLANATTDAERAAINARITEQQTTIEIERSRGEMLEAMQVYLKSVNDTNTSNTDKISGFNTALTNVQRKYDEAKNTITSSNLSQTAKDAAIKKLDENKAFADGKLLVPSIVLAAPTTQLGITSAINRIQTEVIGGAVNRISDPQKKLDLNTTAQAAVAELQQWQSSLQRIYSTDSSAGLIN